MNKKLLDLNINESSTDNDIPINIKAVSAKDIAIIGMHLKLPGANNVREFWNNIRNGADLIREFPASRRKDTDNYLKYIGTDTEKIKYMEVAYLHEIDKFDYNFFQISPKEASLMDPNQRLFLETAWGAIEDAGYGGSKLMSSKTGVYVGFGVESNYKRLIDEFEPSSYTISTTGNLSSIIASRISYLLDFKGPCMLINTACSSSLVAVHVACEAIRSGTCETAIVGSVRTILLQLEGNEKLGIESSDGKTKTFDDSSDGTGAGEGVLAILIKSLDKALEDRDNIYAVIKGSEINQDGRSVGLTAPNALAQEYVITRAWRNAGVNPETISYIEAHGTGTKLGDPIEIDGIQRSFKRYTDKKQFCAIASLKSNIGHLDCAAGLGGLIKAALALKNKEIPPTIHFNKPNKKINFEDSPIYVNDKLRYWETEGYPRRCGISSFGISGTNCHIVMEEAPKIKEKVNKLSVENIFTLSGKTEQALLALVENFKEFLNFEHEFDLDDACYIMNTGRGHFEYRLAMIVNSIDELKNKINMIGCKKLNEYNNNGIYYGKHVLRSSHRVAKEKDDLTLEEKAEINKHAASIVNNIADLKGKDYMTALQKICQFYTQGADIEWEKIYKGQGRGKISLPTYPFERTRCWLENPEGTIAQQTKDEHLFYTVGWEHKILEKSEENTGKCYILILHDEKGFGGDISKILKDEGNKVVGIRAGKSFEIIKSDEYIVTGSQHDYERLFEEIGDYKSLKIVHLSTITNDVIKDLDGLERTLKRGLYSLLSMTKALNNLKGEVEIIIVSEYVNEVTGEEELIKPENATLYGLGKIIGMENSKAKCRFIDVDKYTELNTIAKELDSSNNNYSVAYRKNKRYVEEIKEVETFSSKKSKIEIRDEGVYIITGGLGRIGLEIARCLSQINNVNLSFINRTQMPDRDKWDSIVKADNDKILCKRIRTIREIENKGSKVLCYSADISNESELKRIILELKEKYYRINGIIHSAGEGVGKVGLKLKDESEESFNAVMLPKVQGTWLLYDLTRNEEMDFFVMFSSVITSTGGIRVGSYITANSYLDSLCAYSCKTGRKALTINWPTWESPETKTIINEASQMFKLLNPTMATNAFYDSLNRDNARLIIGELNYSSDILSIEGYLPFRLSEEIRDKINKKREFKNISNYTENSSQLPSVKLKLKGRNSDSSYSAVEKKIALVWSNILGVNEINIDDDFFELGGNSILAIRMEAEMEKKNLPIKFLDIDKYRTIRQLASYINNRRIDLSINAKEDFDTSYIQQDTEKLDIPSVTGNAEELEMKSVIEERKEAVSITDANKRELPISAPPIKCYQYDAYPLSILSNFSDYLPWFYSNYIQLYCNKDFINEGIFNLEFYEHMQAFKSPWLQTQTMYWETLSKLNINAIDFFIEHIDLNYYIYTIVNDFYIPNRYEYEKHDFIHDIFIYGYDKEKEIFSCSGYNDRGLYSHHVVTFSDFEKAFRSIDVNKHNYYKNDIYLIRYFNNAKYIFDYQHVKNQIQDYLYSKNTSEGYRRYSNPLNDKIFGISTYESLKQYLYLVVENKITYDIKHFQLFYEHKKCMVMRAKYIHENIEIDSGKLLYEKYKIFEDKSVLCRNLFLKYYVKKDENIINKIICLLDEIAAGEKDILSRIILQ